MRIKIVRSKCMEDMGGLFIRDKRFCDTFEPCGQIPTGEYKLVRGAHPVDGHPVPMIKDVPTIGDVFFYSAERSAEKPYRLSCGIGVGTFTEDENFFIWGYSCLLSLYRIMERCWRAREEVVLEITEEE